LRGGILKDFDTLALIALRSDSAELFKDGGLDDISTIDDSTKRLPNLDRSRRQSLTKGIIIKLCSGHFTYIWDHTFIFSAQLDTSQLTKSQPI